ncbi:type II secretion system GspH family protein (plasmid) [Pseudomonas aeruginosa]|nr:type II secretion system protein [Pseudomonas aeruginosa]UTN36044.1 type II secretion system GspH family protein [Pseudomonas aeruginosa]
MKNSMARKQAGFTLIELVVVMAVMALIAALMTPNMMEELNLRRANLTAEDTTAILDAARSYRVATASWPGGATCATAINVLKTGGYLGAMSTSNRYNNAITTTCDTRTFSVVQAAVKDWDGYLVNSIAGTEITAAATNTIRSTIGVPGSEPALSNKLTRVDTGNLEDNRMRTNLLMGGWQINEAGNINFSQANPTISAQSGSLTLSAQNGQVVIPAGQTLTVDDIVVRSRGNRRLSASLPNFVHIGTYIVRDGWLVQKPACATGGVPKGALRPAAMRGGYTSAAGAAYVGRYGFNYRLTSTGAYWSVTAVAEGYAADYANLDSLIDVFCYYPT